LGLDNGFCKGSDFFSLGLVRESLSDYEPFESQCAKRLLLMKYEVFGVVKLFWSLGGWGCSWGIPPVIPILKLYVS
jgi:hypothetical protein